MYSKDKAPPLSVCSTSSSVNHLVLLCVVYTKHKSCPLGVCCSNTRLNYRVVLNGIHTKHRSCPLGMCSPNTRVNRPVLLNGMPTTAQCCLCWSSVAVTVGAGRVRRRERAGQRASRNYTLSYQFSFHPRNYRYQTTLFSLRARQRLDIRSVSTV